MAKLLSLILALSGIAVACFSNTSPENGAANASAPQDRERQRGVNVTRLWEQNCAGCHGDNGAGGGGGTQTFLTRELFDQKHDKHFFEIIKNGSPHGGMEGYGETLSDEEIWGLVVHIREMQGRALREEFGSPKPVNGVYKSQRHNYKIETVVDSGLKTPWAIDWLPDGRMLVTNRPGTLVLVDKGNVRTVTGTPEVLEIGQGGLMEVAVHPDYAKNGWVYLSFSDPAGNDARSSMTKLVRGKLKITGDSAVWTDQQTIFQNDPSTYNSSGVHFGSRIVFDGKGHIFFSIGERGNGQLAQDLTKPNGKIFRIREDGTVPADNPFADAESKAKGYMPAIWTYGHRNPQGLVQDLEGTLWDTEHGPRGGDEVNRIEKGKNYGWPVVAFSINYNDSPHRTPWPGEGQEFEMPVFRWLPSTGACGLDVARGAAFPQWRGDLLAGGLVGQNLDRLRLKGNEVVEREELVHGLGRIRDVSVGPDGTVYLALNQPDKIIRLVPAP